MRNTVDKLARASRAFITDLNSNARAKRWGGVQNLPARRAGARGQILSFGADYTKFAPSRARTMAGRATGGMSSRAFARWEALRVSLSQHAQKK